MKRVTVQWVERRTLEVPDDTPTNSIDELHKHLHTDITPFCVQMDTCGYEIINIDGVVGKTVDLNLG